MRRNASILPGFAPALVGRDAADQAGICDERTIVANAMIRIINTMGTISTVNSKLVSSPRSELCNMPSTRSNLCARIWLFIAHPSITYGSTWIESLGSALGLSTENKLPKAKVYILKVL